jgi:hypothetical protein
VEGACPVIERFAVRKCRLNQIQNTSEMSEMIPKLWLAAFLGVLLGAGIAYATSIPVASTANMNFPLQPIGVNRQTETMVRPVESSSQLAFVSLLVGIVIATPVFLVAKRRS